MNRIYRVYSNNNIYNNKNTYKMHCSTLVNSNFIAYIYTYKYIYVYSYCILFRQRSDKVNKVTSLANGNLIIIHWYST